MEVIISADTIIKFASVLGALGVICGAIVAMFKHFSKQKALSDEVKETRHEQVIICYALLACLKGLRELGCNGAVTQALNEMEKHLNKAAHGDENINM